MSVPPCFSLFAATLLFFGNAASAQTPWLDGERKDAMAAALSQRDPLLASGGVARALALFEHDEDPSTRSKFIDDVVAGAQHPLARDSARRQRAVDRGTGGDFDGAAADLDALGGPRELRCIGPFANVGGGGFGTNTPADDVIASADGAVAGLDRPVSWRLVPREVRGGFDVGSRFVARREVRALCTVVVEVTAATTAALRLGSSGQLRALVNGVEVVREDVDRPVAFDQSAAAISLRKGKNVVTVELGVIARSGVVDLRVTRLDGSALKASWSTTLPAAMPAAAPAPAAKEKLAASVPTATGDLARLRASTAVALRTRAFDHRARPTLAQQILQALVDQAASKAEKSSALLRLGSEIQNRDPTAARVLFEAGLVDDETAPGAWASLAEMRADLGDDTAAARLFEKSVSLAKTSVIYRAARWDFERRRGILGVVIDREILQAATTTKSPRLLALAADVLEDRQDHQGALALRARAKARDFLGWANARVEMLGLQLNAKPEGGTSPHTELLALLRQRLTLTPLSHSTAELFLQHLLDDLGAPPSETAAAARRAAVDAFLLERRRLYPERPEPLMLAAREALSRGDRPAAIAFLKQARERAPEDGDLEKFARALDGDADARDDRLVKWLPAFEPAAARKNPPAAATKLGAHIESRSVATRFFENGQLRQIEDVVVVVHDAKKAAGFRSFSWGYTGGREELEVLVAERVRKDGRIEPAERIFDRGQDGKENGAYSDGRSKTALFGGIEDGDVFHVRVRREATGLQNLFGNFYGELEPFQGRYPLKTFRFVVEAPKSRPLFWGGRGAPEPIITEVATPEKPDEAVRTYDFVAKDVTAIEGEPSMPPWLEFSRYLSVSTYQNWADLGVWYEDLIRDQFRLDDDLKKVVIELKAAAKDESDLIRRTYEFVVKQTRYVGIELGIHGWKPYPVSEVFRRRFGDCKDKASLLVALLRAEGIAANVALVRTIQMGHAGAEPPSMWAFNHAIAYVPSLDLFLDGTAEQSGWRELPTMDQGALSLIVDGAKSRLVTIPVQDADSNRNVSAYTLSLQQDGALVVVGTERFRGHANSAERRHFADPATRRETLERQLSQSIAGATVKKVEVSDLDIAADEIHYNFEAVLPRRASVGGDGTLTMPLSLYPHDLSGSYADQSSREMDLFFDHPWRTRNVMRYVLPPGFSVVDLPTGGSVKGPHIEFTQTITTTPDGFIVDEDTAVVVRRVPAAQYDRFRKDALAADALMKRSLRITRKGAK